MSGVGDQEVEDARVIKWVTAIFGGLLVLSVAAIVLRWILGMFLRNPFHANIIGLFLGCIAGARYFWTSVRRELAGPKNLPGHCRKCGYNLTGNVPGGCPECGACK